MKYSEDLKILPEDRVELTQDQKNMIEMAFAKQVSPEDAEFIEKIKKESKPETAFGQLSKYFTDKYGVDFGMIYLAAITGGEEKYNEAVESIEKMNARERVERQNSSN